MFVTYLLSITELRFGLCYQYTLHSDVLLSSSLSTGYVLQVSATFPESFIYSLTTLILSVLIEQYFVLQLTEAFLQ